MFEEEHELNHQAREAVNTSQYVSEADEELSLSEGTKDQPDSVEPPADLKSQLSSLLVSKVTIQ